MLTLLHIAGGVALILYGIRVLRKGLDRLFGAKLARWLQRLGRNRWRAGLMGLFVSFMSPSSSTITLLGVQFVRSHLLRFEQMLAVMLGASIGLTIELQLISFELHEQAPILILAGIICFQFLRTNLWRGIGQALLGLGLIFLAVGIIKTTAEQNVSGSNDVQVLLGIFAKHPWAMLALGAVVTVALQSSTAALGLMLAMASANVLSLEVALPYVIGADVGLGLTTLAVGYSDPDSRRLGLGYFLMRLILAVILMLCIQWYAPLVEWSGAAAGRQIANAHSIFNILLAVLWIAPLPIVTKLMLKVVPESPQPVDEHTPIHLSDAYLDSPSLVFGQSLREIMRVVGIVESMLRDFWIALRERDLALCDDIQERDDIVDALDRQIKRFLTKAGGEAYSDEESATQVNHLRFIGCLETVGDIIDRNLVELARKRIRIGGRFSEEGFRDLQREFDLVFENLHIASTAFATRDKSLARSLLRHKKHLDKLDFELRKRHFERLTQGQPGTLETSSVHLDILTNLKAVNSQLTIVVYPILEDTVPTSGGEKIEQLTTDQDAESETNE
ncbi:MAG: Na/Pi cotransporter family protein [Phycisphaerales bacterium]|nr:Na/Pi cotransporter family protein [Phycisphaerales bacterium]